MDIRTIVVFVALMGGVYFACKFWRITLCAIAATIILLIAGHAQAATPDVSALIEPSATSGVVRSLTVMEWFILGSLFGIYAALLIALKISRNKTTELRGVVAGYVKKIVQLESETINDFVIRSIVGSWTPPTDDGERRDIIIGFSNIATQKDFHVWLRMKQAEVRRRDRTTANRAATPYPCKFDELVSSGAYLSRTHR